MVARLRGLKCTIGGSPHMFRVEHNEHNELILAYKKEAIIKNAIDKKRIKVLDQNNQEYPLLEIRKLEATNKAVLRGKFDLDQKLQVKLDRKVANARQSWRLKDKLYAYQADDLGATLFEDGRASLKVWSPSAEMVKVVLYDKDNQDKVLGSYPMNRQEKGVWQLTLDQALTGLENHRSYFYHYEINRGKQTVLALDPYAKSMAEWNLDESISDVGKAAIVNPSKLGPELDFAEIDNYEGRQDAIIYEVHIRDFTSDPDIETDHRFGTFSAFVERLDYIKDLGVTHIQLLPVMNYYLINEGKAGQHLSEWSSKGQNYNWGYDPHSYFALSGMYSEDASDPELRIVEFKNLVNEIHKRGMGVVLDVVYNHTAQLHILEDLEPNYYHFMNSDGSSRESFGGGRLGTTHHMARRILLDSIYYFVEEFKVDGFRFDMMGDIDAQTIQMAFDKASKLHPKLLMIGEGWITYAGDEGDYQQAADQSWVSQTDAVGVFADEIRNELKSGYPEEGHPRFLTGGARHVHNIYQNLIGNPSNFKSGKAMSVVQYIEAHDNLTLHDIIAQSIRRDPKYHEAEIHRRLRIGNLMILTSQGTVFIHSGQEYGRTKQFKHPDYIGPVENPPYKSHYLTDQNGQPFEYPYFIHDSYNASDMVNHFDWDKITDSDANPIHHQTYEYTKGLIQIRRQTTAFRHNEPDKINQHVRPIYAPEISEWDTAIAYETRDAKGDIYAIFVNASQEDRYFSFGQEYAYLNKGQVIADGAQAGLVTIKEPVDVKIYPEGLALKGLTATIIRVEKQNI